MLIALGAVCSEFNPLHKKNIRKGSGVERFPSLNEKYIPILYKVT